MKSVSKKFALAAAVVFIMLLSPQSRPLQNKPDQPLAPPKAITGSGCVEAGVEAGCIVLRDVKSHTLYNLYFSGKKPDMGAGIQFEGSKQNGATICMQGEPVKVSKWTPAKIACSSGSGEKAR